MSTLTQGQIQAVAVAAGLPDPSLMAAIAMAESSGRTDVVNSIGCVGLWQINQPEHVKNHSNWTVAYLKNPLNNALAAKTVLKSQGLDAWEAYTNGAYLKYYKGQASQSPNAPQGVGGTIVGGIEGTIGLGSDLLGGATNNLGLGNVTDGLSSIAGDFTSIVKDTILAGEWISKASNWVRIGYVLGGIVLVAIGLYATASETSAGKAAIKMMKKV